MMAIVLAAALTWLEARGAALADHRRRLAT